MVYTLVVGPLACNCYIVACDRTGEAVVIDPGAEPGRIAAALRSKSLTARSIINTHGHADHIGANGALGLPVLIHEMDKDFLQDPAKNLSASFGYPIVSPPASRILADGEEVSCGGLTLSVIHTPGHTPGGISLRTGNILFTGDTLFCGGVGRTDLPYGDTAALLRSIRERLLCLGDDTVVFPGHGERSTIGRERRENPFFD